MKSGNKWSVVQNYKLSKLKLVTSGKTIIGQVKSGQNE